MCAKCRKAIPRHPSGNTDNGLHLTFDGGYGEFIDSWNPDDTDHYLSLCHECGHELADWLGIDVRNWHTHGLHSGQHADHHDREEVGPPSGE